MADNVDYTPGSGATIAADEVDGVLYQRIKLVQGIDGVAVDVSAEAPLAVELKQNYETNGPLLVAPDTTQQWPVKLQGVDTISGYLRDLKVTPKGELLTSPPDHQYFKTMYNGAVVANTVLLGPIMAEGYASGTLLFSTGISPGALQFSLDGLVWNYVPVTYIAASSGNMNTSALLYIGANQIGTFSLPPCAQIRVIAGSTFTLTNCLVSLMLSKTPKVDYVVARISEVQSGDNVVQSTSQSFSQLLIGGADATKKTRVLAADGTVNSKSQGATNQAAGASTATPFYGHVLTTAITRIAPYSYGADQPAALQSNTRGELQVDQNETRRMLEQQLLAQQAAAMQLLDPNWGFELR